MKILLFILSSFIQRHDADSIINPYQLQFQGLGSNMIQLSSFAGKPTVVFEFKASNSSASQLQSLDTLYRNSHGQLNVIAIPVQDFGAVSAADSLNLLVSSLGLSYSIAGTGYAQKSSGLNQQVLLRWITHVGSNGHFDEDISEEGDIFIISATGILYATLSRTFSCNGPEIKQVLNNPPSY